MTGLDSARAAAQEASAESSGPGLSIGANTSYAQQVPAISIETTTPAVTNIGKVVEQQILVRNVGPVAAENVEVRGTFSKDAALVSTEPKAGIANNSTLVWKLGRIPAGGQQKLTVQVKPMVAGELNCDTSVSFTSNASVKVQVREPKLKLSCNGPAEVTVGSNVRIGIEVTNTGTGTAEGVQIRQLVPDVVQTGGPAVNSPLQLTIGTLEPGETRVVETATVAREPGQVRIGLIAQGADGVQATASHTLKVRGGKLAVSTSGPDFRYQNRKASYAVTVANSGDAVAEHTNLAVGLPEGLEFIDASGDAVFDPSKRTVTWKMGSLDAGQKREFNFTVLAKTEGEHLQRAVAWADNELLAKADKVTRVEGTTAVTVEVVDLDDPVEINTETAYQIHIANRGSKNADRVQVVAIIPDGMQFIAAEGGTPFRTEGQKVIFTPIDSLNAQAAVAIQVRVKGTKQGKVRFRAEVTSPSLSEPITADELTEVYGD
jgi:uncharacterized repeat protein (TIGR01451 family)